MGKNLSVRDVVLMAFYVALFMVLDTFINTSYQWIDSNNIDNEEYSSYFYG